MRKVKKKKVYKIQKGEFTKSQKSYCQKVKYFVNLTGTINENVMFPSWNRLTLKVYLNALGKNAGH